MPSTKRQKLTLAVCAVTHAVQDGLGAALYVLMPLLAQAFGLSYAQVGVIRAARSAATSVFELPSGLLAERLGERRLLAFGLAFAGVGYLWLAAADGYFVVLLSLLVAGTGAAFQHALSSAVVSQAHDASNRRSALGLYNAAGDFGKLAFTSLFGLLVGVGFAWNAVVAGFGLLSMLLSVAVWGMLQRLGAGAAVPSVHNSEADLSPGWGIRSRSGFTALCAAVSLDTTVQSSFLVFLPFLMAEKALPERLVPVAVVLILVGGMFGKAGCGYLAQRLGTGLSLTLIQCATAAGILALVALPPMAGLLALPLLGLFLQGSTSITYAAVGDVVRSDRQSRGFALLYSVSGIASALGPVLLGLLGDEAGLGVAAAAMAGLSLAAIGPSLVLGRRMMVGEGAEVAG